MQVILAASGGGSWGTMTEDCQAGAGKRLLYYRRWQTLGRAPGNLHQKPCASYPAHKTFRNVLTTVVLQDFLLLYQN